MPSGVPILETREITKTFGRVVANKSISVRLFQGEIVAILGENGAGKTTLMNMLFGLYRPDSGQILIDGVLVQLDSPRAAIARGLGMVHQHFMLVPTLTVTQNVILGEEPVRWAHVQYGKARRSVADLSRRYGLAVDPDARLESLSVGLQQRVEILKALYRRARILILDEPTAVLTPAEVEELFAVLKRLAESGTSIIIITHKLEEVKRLSGRVYVLRRGELAGERRTEVTGAAELANLMVGRDVVLEVQHPASRPSTQPILKTEHLCARSLRGVAALKDVSLSVGHGEIVGIAGVEGNGQKELCEVVSGLAQPESGSIQFKGNDVTRWSVRRRLDAGMGYVPQDRRGAGLILPFTVAENLALGRSDVPPLSRGGLLDQAAMRARGKGLMEAYDIRAEGPDALASTLSGGNQQKVVLAREFSRSPAFLLISQPTRGLDVGAIEYIYRRILELREEGAAIFLVSMELDELFALSDRIAVLQRGEVVFESAASATNEAEVGAHMIRGRAERSAS